MQQNPETRKFVFDANAQESLSNAQLRESITTGSCDFDNQPAVQGRAISTDVFLVCERHLQKINKNNA